MPTFNIVDQGASNTGGSAIDPILTPLIGAETTIVFPPGTYKLNELVVPSGVGDFELIAPDGARLVPGQSGDNVRWIDVYSNGFTLDGFELDMRGITLPPFIRMNSDAGNWELRRLITRGRVRAATDTNVGSNNSGEARTYFRLSAAAGTRGLLQDCYFHAGSCAPTEASNRRAILIESAKGALTFNRCWFHQWGENTIYAKKPEGKFKILNCYFRNSQNGLRLGGNTEVRNCVSIKDNQHPVSAWSGGSLQRGVSVEAVNPSNSSAGINSYDGTLTIADCDFYHRYLDSSCGGAITASVPCQRIEVQRVRISYESRKNHDAIYTYDGWMGDGTPANLEYLQLEDVHVTNDHNSEYAIFIGQEPDTWGSVSGVLGGSGAQTNSSYISERMTLNGSPKSPRRAPPLRSPPPVGEIPMQPSQLVRIDNTGYSSPTSYQITAGEAVLPAGNDGASITMDWGPNGQPSRLSDSTQATGTVPAGKVYAFYVTGGIEATEADGPATWIVDGDVYDPDASSIFSTNTISTNQATRGQWQQAESDDQTGVTIAKPLSHNGGQPVHVRLRNDANAGFEYMLEEWAYLDGSHTTETFHILHSLSMEPSEREFNLSDGTRYRVKAGEASVTDEFSTVSMGNFFETERPVILAQSQTYNGPDPIVTRVTNVSNTSFRVRVQEEEANGSHTTETVGYIGLQQATGQINTQSFEVRRTDQTVTDQWTQIDFQQEYETPRFVAGLQTFNGLDPANLRYRNLSGTGVEVRVEEEQSADTETAHTTEAVGYVVFEGATT
ncbi:hypothetical protein SAMN05421858_3486 [Haladaptatus litoreus]|uniref:Right handed beta helix region n=1 Tax=Haladaptatus litoreus TaxID=553468 RepID=A0A1N7DBD4_9EURY|nr:hypothetical protein [Haladaptatus litoreus]SIR73158.1 hypothetical protein SAMN05421858_3486 [Haladaptatus litoreus]